jgi:hypothetical protein
MKKQLRLLYGLGLVSLFIMGTSVSSSYADGKCRPKSPLRGTYVFSQVVPVIPGLPSATEVGTITVDDCGNLIGYGVFNGPGFSGFEFDFEGPCVLRASGYEADCTLTSTFGTAHRYCVLMGKGGAGCFEKWHCINSNEATEPGVVLLADIERVHAGTCK